MPGRKQSFGVIHLLPSLLLLSACASVPLANLESGTTPIEACRVNLSAPKFFAADSLDPDSIRMANWNIHKQANPDSGTELLRLSSNADLVLLQEASLRPESVAAMGAEHYWSFAPGYRTSGAVSGVLTMSGVAPLTRCSFETKEPVLRSPKATSITQYALSTTAETLVVVNIHAVNFTTGLGAFRNQFDQIADVLRDHTGPVIVAGDFNTWRNKRLQIVHDFAETLALESVEFGDDHRVTVFGNALDHVFARGLSADQSSTRRVATSDHNPMSVTFSLGD